MTRIFLILTFILTWVVSRGQELRNVIRGEVEGLEAGDRIILSVELVDGEAWVATDSVVVNEAGKFTLETGITGSWVMLTRLTAGEAFDPVDLYGAGLFLEGHAGLCVTGSTRNWAGMKKSGGLYAHPGMQRLIHVTDSMNAIGIQGNALIDHARETGDEQVRARAIELFQRTIALHKVVDSLERVFRETYPGMAYSARILRHDYRLEENPDEYEAAFLALSPEVQDSPAGRLVCDHVASVRAAGVGFVAPDFTLADMNGREVTLSAFRGKYVLIDFWGSWCGPCRQQSNPLLVELHDALQSKGASVEFIGVAISEQNDENWLNAIAEDKLTWIQLNDAHSGKSKTIENQYAIRGVPTCLLISPEGIILHKDHPVAIIPKIKELFGL